LRPVLPTALAESTALSRATISALPETKHSLAAAAVSDPRWAYTINETARVLSVSRSTIYKLISRKSLRAIKLLGRTVITRDSIEELLSGNDR
jgi:excisionase family DNA binding protein